MKSFIARFSATLALILMSVFASGQNNPQVITLPLSNPGEPISLEIEILSAHIEVIGEDRKDAEFSFSVSGSGRKIVTPSGTQSLPGGGYEFEVEEQNNHIEVDTNALRSKVTIIAKIPRQADLELSTVNKGEIIVRNIEGRLQLGNVNGPITATNISGSVIAEAINKTITVDFTKLSANEISSFSTINGDLQIGLAAKMGAELHLDSARGEITSDFEVEVKPSKPVVERDGDEDGVSVRIENSIIATINGGGPIIKMKTLNGDIQINKSDD